MPAFCVRLVFITVLFSGAALSALATETLNSRFHPGALWKDTNGMPINAHGGGVLFHEGRYYWYGEHKLPGRSEEQGAGGGMHCYSSTDLLNWKDEGVVLPVDRENPASDLALGGIFERPKVLFNAKTRKFVMFFKLYPRGTGYDTGYVGVATATSPQGPFTYQHKFLGGSAPKGTGDYVMVEDSQGVVYHLTVRKPDKVFVAGPLRDDYLFPAGEYFPVPGITTHTEAPAVMRVGDLFYLIGSGSSGWKPNTARAFVSSAITGPYRELGNPTRGKNPHNGLGSELTFGGQISFLLPVQGKREQFIAMFDVWKPERAIEGRYVWLPVRIEDGKPVIEWRDTWDLSVFNAPAASR